MNSVFELSLSRYHSKFIKMKKILFFSGLLILLNSLEVYAQTSNSQDTTKIENKKLKDFLAFQLDKGTLSFNIYGDFGYVVGPQRTHTYYDPIVGETVTNFGRRDYTSYPLYANQFSLAYAYIQAQYEIENKIKIKMAFHTGHIVDALYIEETPSTKIIRELSIYYNFNSKWATEIGIFPSYFGAEIVTNKENLHATRAYIADFTPDYEAGIRMHYKPNKENTFSAMVLNGWQVIRETNTTKAFALSWNINKPGKINGNWNLMFADEQPIYADKPLFRHYQNIYFKISLGKRWMILPVMDVMIERRAQTEPPGWNHILAPAFSARYKIDKHFGIAGRYEHIYDPKSLIPELKTGTPNGWQSNAFTLTLEYIPSPIITFRLEGKYGVNKDAVFRNSLNNMVRQDWYGIFSTSFYF
jgi:hypothetical protein